MEVVYIVCLSMDLLFGKSTEIGIRALSRSLQMAFHIRLLMEDMKTLRTEKTRVLFCKLESSRHFLESNRFYLLRPKIRLLTNQTTFTIL